ncbi:hypothetical protein BC937DRAFT_95240 [Endogone sp. FLAS-F59071]|nr:hypothetical protein BC937DRAFT_95240 [Endogone sp. FLAS-F59071]|eukprot:RUS13492.1 hypothetical protein BC937DRAFT_95240 [Endogone sp. FLAS-F59071]
MLEDGAYIHPFIPLEPLFGLNYAMTLQPMMEGWPLLVVENPSLSVKKQPPPLEGIFDAGSLENGVGRANHVDSIMWPVEKKDMLACGMERVGIAADVSEATLAASPPLEHFSDSLTLMDSRKMRRSDLEHAQARWDEEIGSRPDGCVGSHPSFLPPDPPLRRHVIHPSQNAVYIPGSQEYTPNLPSPHNHLPVVTTTPSQYSTKPVPPKRFPKRRRAWSFPNTDPADSALATQRGSKRPRFSIDQTRMLNTFMFAHAIKRMPSEEEKEQLAGLTRMTVEQVTKWFQNHRFRVRRNGEAEEFERLKREDPRSVWDYGSYRRFKERERRRKTEWIE